ncbi:MAG: hypothetical protein ACFFDN_03210 [Candidatus Hodarchaeota archaeon]
MSINKIFYYLKPIIPRRFQIVLRRIIIHYKRKQYVNVWPIDKNTVKMPESWSGWPENKQFALILKHDVDTIKGLEKCKNLMELEQNLGFRSSFNFVPERYFIHHHLRNKLTKNGFEVGVHGLYHDGKLYSSMEVFKKRAKRINHYLKEWKSVGFNSPSMHHNLAWIHELNIKYDASTFDTDPFEPQPDGIGTIFPFWIKANLTYQGYIELPYTLPQDFTLFVLMKEKNIDIWKRKLDWIAENGGMALLNTHPDYMNFKGGKLNNEDYPAEYYVQFLKYVKSKYSGIYWHVLPKEVARFFRKMYSIS